MSDRIKLAAALAILFGAANASAQVRVKDIVELEGAHALQALGVGLVVGLDGTGSDSLFTRQLVRDYFLRTNRDGKTPDLPAGACAAVMVSLEIDAFAKKGSTTDVMIHALDDSRSLKGGTLLLTKLKGPYGETRAIAQGAVKLASSRTDSGRIINGGVIETLALTETFKGESFKLKLKEPNHDTARIIARRINESVPECARADGDSSVIVHAPKAKLAKSSEFVREIGELPVTPLPAADGGKSCTRCINDARSVEFWNWLASLRRAW